MAMRSRTPAHASACMSSSTVGSGIKHLRKRATRGTANRLHIRCNAGCEEDSQKVFITSAGNGEVMAQGSTESQNTFVHHQSS